MVPAADRRGSIRSVDSTSVLCTYAVVVLVLPAGLTLSGGTITLVVLGALACGWLWVLGQVGPRFDLAGGPQPVRRVILLFGASALLSYVAATTQPRAAIEATAADRGLLVIAALCGTALLAADGIRSRARLDALVRVLVAAGAVAAVIAILQHFLAFDPSNVLATAGLSRADEGFAAITERSGFNRVAGTALHPIEFSAVLTMLIPLALHLAHWARQWRWWIATVLIAAAIPMTVSRTGTLALLAVLVVLVPTWDRRRRWEMARLGILVVLAVRLAAPGLLGTMRALFLNFNVDPSVQTRRSDYAYVGEFVSEHPVFGRGFGTFLPERYDFIDNQYLLSLIETGLVGLVTLVAVFAVGIAVAVGVRRASDDPLTRDLALSLVAAAVVPLVTFATFDFLSFPSARSLAFLIVGCAGALWRIERSSREAGPPDRSVEAGSLHRAGP
jgi:O-antigen ligase